MTSLYSSSPDAVKAEQLPPTSTSEAGAAAAAASASKTKTKTRKRVNTAEKRHQHNAVERQRRETLNGKFIVLARLLPSLANHGRPSKSAIVNGSITHLKKQREQRLLASRLLRQLCAERDALAKECNEWRAASGLMGGKKAGETTAWTEEMEEVCAVEKETFGEFVNMGEGEEGDDDMAEQDEGAGVLPTVPEMAEQRASLSMPSVMARGMGIEAATAAVAAFTNTGLMTPRSSAEIDPLSLALGLSVPLPGVQRQRGSQAQQTQPRPIPQQQQQSHAAMSGMDWASGFSFGPDMSMQTLGSSTSSSSLPFNAFMSDSLESMSDSPGSLLGMPTPPTSGNGVGGDFSRFTHTPSPRSSGSFEDVTGGPKSHLHPQAPQFAGQPNFGTGANGQQAWTTQQQQQLLFLHSVQQQQLQNSQLAEMQSRALAAAAAGASPTGINITRAASSAGSDVSYMQAAAAAGNAQSLPMFPTTAFQNIHQQQQFQAQQAQAHLHHHQQQQQQAQQQVPRMSNDQLEAWRKLATGGAGRAEFGLWAQAALKGF